MSFGEILDTGFRLLRDHFLLLATPAALVYVPLAFASALLVPAAPVQPEDVLAPLAWVAVFALLALIAMPVVTAAVTHAIGEAYLGRPVGVGESLRAGLGLMLPLMGTWLLAGLVVFGGLLLLILPGLYLMLCFLLLTQVMVLERAFGRRALARSRNLMRGHLLRGSGILFVGGMLVGLLSWGVELGLGWIPLLGPIGSGVAQAVGFAYTTSLGVLLYFDIRCREEAFDLEHLARLVEAGSAAGPAGSVSPGR